MTPIYFNKPYLTGKESNYMREAVETGKLSGDGVFTHKCQDFLVKKYGFKKVLLTNSCTDALEMAAILCNLKQGDEVIAPSFTFVSTVNAFVLRGAKIVFADSSPENPNIDVSRIESLITPKTKVIVVVHYAGIACNMDAVMDIAWRHNLFVVEDAAQCIDSFYKDKPLGSIGNVGAFSFHETKNIISGEGGMLTLNDDALLRRAEIIWEKGTNRSAFFRGETNKYEWIDIGSSFLPSEITAAFLFAQLECLNTIQAKRKELWETYNTCLQELALQNKISLPLIPPYASNNAHLFYILCKSEGERSRLIAYLKENKIQAIFHYQSLHKSPYYKSQYHGPDLPNANFYSDCLLRLPLYYELKTKEVKYICEKIGEFYK